MNPLTLVGLLPAIRKIGVPLLELVLGSKNASVAKTAIDIAGEALGVPGQPDAIAREIERDPEAAGARLREVEADPEMRRWLVEAVELDRQALGFQLDMANLDREGGWFGWAWRPAGMWLNLALWALNAVALVGLNGILRLERPGRPLGGPHLVHGDLRRSVHGRAHDQGSRQGAMGSG